MAPTASRPLLLAVAAAAALACVAASAAAPLPPLPTSSSEADDDRNAALQLVLFGGTGSLAKKYLWQAVLETADVLYPGRLLVTAVAREGASTGTAKVEAAVRGARCGGATVGALNATAHAAYCDRLKARLLGDVSYVSVGEPEAGFARLGAALEAGAADPSHVLLGRVLYMAVGPEAVVPLLSGLTSHGGVELRSAPRGFPTRVVLEKPVGRDAYSAGALIQAVDGLTDPGCTLIADHYLGKAGVLAAAGVRSRMVNDLNLGKPGAAGSKKARATPAPDTDYSAPPKPGEPPHRFDDREGWVRLATTLRYTEVTALEVEDAAGRTGFYNEHGVVRDVLQSHGTVMAEAALLLPNQRWDSGSRELLLREFRPMAPQADREAAAVGDGIQPPRPVSRLHAASMAPHRFGVYLGYPQLVAAEAGHRQQPSRAEAAQQPFPARLPFPPAIADVGDFMRRTGRSPTSSELWNVSTAAWAAPDARGAPFATATAAQVVVTGLGMPLVFTAGKALGERLAFVRQHYAPALPPPGSCGPVTVTYHMHGRPMLPPGADEASAWPASFPSLDAIAASHAPAVIFTGFCGETVAEGLLPDPRALFAPGWSSPDWPATWTWNVSYDAHAGVLAAVPTLPTSPADASPTLSAWGLADGALTGVPAAAMAAASSSDDDEDEDDDEDDAAAANPRDAAAAAAVAVLRSRAALTHISPRLARSRLKLLASQPGRSSGDAYRLMLAAALGGDRSKFQSPGEVTALWALWEPIAALQDETVATGRALHWARPDLQAAYMGARSRLVDAAEVAAGRQPPSAANASAADAAKGRRAAGVSEPTVRSNTLAGEYDEDEDDDEEEEQTPVLTPEERYAGSTGMLSGSGGLVYVYTPGDRSWLRGLPAPLPLPVVAPRGGYRAPAAGAAAGVRRVVPPASVVTARLAGSRRDTPRLPVERVVSSGPAAEVSSQFAADLIALAWDGLRGHAHPFVHWALDAGPEMTPLLDRWTSMDALAAAPWRGLHVWGVAERRPEGTAPDCNICYLVGVFAGRVGLPEPQLHGLLHPNVSHVNGLAAAALAAQGGGFDLVTLRVPGANATHGPGGFVGLLPPLANYTSHPYLAGTGQPSAVVTLNRTEAHLARVPGLASGVLPMVGAGGGRRKVDARSRAFLDTLGTPGGGNGGSGGAGSTYVSSGLGLSEAVSTEDEVRSELTEDQLLAADAASRPGLGPGGPPGGAPGAPDGAPGGSSSSSSTGPVKLPFTGNRLRRGMPDMGAVPPRPLLPYTAAIDVRLSPDALARARNVWVVVPKSRLMSAAAAVARAGVTAAAIGADGVAKPVGGEDGALLAANTAGGYFFPPDVVDDIALVTLGRWPEGGASEAGAIRIYVVGGV